MRNTSSNSSSVALDYRALIYAAIVTTPWRFADLQHLEVWLRRRHGVLGHLSVEEFRTAAVAGAQLWFERPSEILRIFEPTSEGASP